MMLSDLIALISEKCEVEPKQAKVIVKAVFTAIHNELAAGGRVLIKGFGTFGVKLRPAREVNDLHNGGRYTVPPTTVVYFNVGGALKAAVKELNLSNTDLGESVGS